MIEWKRSRPEDIGTLYTGRAGFEIVARVYRAENSRDGWVAEIVKPAARRMSGFKTATLAMQEAAAEQRHMTETAARMDARRKLEDRREGEADSEHAARLSGQAMGRKDSGSGAPREGRIGHLAYLEGQDTPRERASFRRGYLETFNDGAFNGAAIKES